METVLHGEATLVPLLLKIDVETITPEYISQLGSSLQSLQK